MTIALSHTTESPLVKGARARLVGTVDTCLIVNGYLNRYQIDVTDYFRELDKVAIYECEASSYRFYFPFSLVGEASLYQQLQKFDWNYKPDKWEYTTALSYLTPGSRVLDVGCGQGAFVNKLNRLGIFAHGLEINASASQVAKQSGLSVTTELIGEHAESHAEVYDAVCSFQVLEHVAPVSEFILDCIRALKPGGLLIFGVPNNDGFLRHDRNNVLNMPPHHMGLWGTESLSSIAEIFSLKLRDLRAEPLAEVDWYTTLAEQRWLKEGWVRSLYYRAGVSALLRKLVRRRAHRIPGHTALAVYEKRQ